MKLNELSRQDIEKHLEERLRFTGTESDLYSRHSAYDFCYNYFRDSYEENSEITSSEKLGVSCLQLGLFLSTWGMYRNSFLQRRSFKIYENLVEIISNEELLWEIDVEDYCLEEDIINADTFEAIMNFKDKISKSFPEHKFSETEKISVTDTLTTKIMMAVFGCVPAFDSYFTATLDHASFGEKSLIEIYKFYIDHKEILNKKQKELKTMDVHGGLTAYTYKKAKIIDLIGFHVAEEEKIHKKKENQKLKEEEKKRKIEISKLKPDPVNKTIGT